MTDKTVEAHAFDLPRLEEWSRRVEAAPPAQALAVAVCDIDNFKTINDTHGHEVGDVVLRSWERTLTGSVPQGAIVGRIGGDEYAVALLDSVAENALIVMEEIRSHFASRSPGAGIPPANVSIGIASRPPHATTTEELLRAAKDALMRAKREGRNRAAIYVEERMTLKSNYYSRAVLDRLSGLSANTSRTEASLLREALDDLLAKYKDQT